MNSISRHGRAFSGKRRRSACCKCICRVESPARGAISSRSRLAARDAGLYSNLITSAVGIDGARLRKLADAGLDHVQISIQDSERASADHIAGYEGAFARKRELAAETERMGLPLTINMVVHRANIDRIGEMIDLAVGNGSEPHRNRACAILRLGAEEPAGLDADRRAGRARCGRGRRVAARSGRRS